MNTWQIWTNFDKQEHEFVTADILQENGCGDILFMNLPKDNLPIIVAAYARVCWDKVTLVSQGRELKGLN